MKRFLLAVLAMLFSIGGNAQSGSPPPPITCAVHQSLWVLHLEKKPGYLRCPCSIYLIDRTGSLFEKGPGEAECRYNSISGDNTGRYTSGYKTIYFERNFSEAIFVHTDSVGVVVQYANCVRNP